jgi:hypothetical protein
MAAGSLITSDAPAQVQLTDGAFLPQFLAAIQKATGGAFNKMRLMMPQSSYATAHMDLVRNHEELAKAQRMTGAAEAGKHRAGMVGTNEAFAVQHKTLNGLLGDVRQTLKGVAITTLTDDKGAPCLAHVLSVHQAHR